MLVGSNWFVGTWVREDINLWARITIKSQKDWPPRTMMIPSYFKIWSLMMIYSPINKTSLEEYLININIKDVSSKNLIQEYIIRKMHWWFANIFKVPMMTLQSSVFFSEYKIFLEIFMDKSIWNKGDSPFFDELIKLFLPKPLVWHNCYSLMMQSGQCLKRKLFHESINSINCTTGDK